MTEEIFDRTTHGRPVIRGWNGPIPNLNLRNLRENPNVMQPRPFRPGQQRREFHLTIQFARALVLPPFATQRGGDWASGLAAWLEQASHQVWATLQEVGWARAHRELDRLAVRYAHNAELVQALRGAMYRGDRS